MRGQAIEDGTRTHSGAAPGRFAPHHPAVHLGNPLRETFRPFDPVRIWTAQNAEVLSAGMGAKRGAEGLTHIRLVANLA